MRSRVALVLLAVVLLATICFLGQYGKTVKFKGVVVDAETGFAVSDAKVVLSTWYFGIFDSNPTSVGAIADKNGKFSIEASPGYWIANVDLQASSPLNKYVSLRNPWAIRDVTLKVAPIPWESPVSAYTYDNFTGQWGGEFTWTKNGEQITAPNGP
jgi:hypothetical protein